MIILSKEQVLKYELSYSQKELSDVILALASGDIGEKEILQWIIAHAK